MTAPLPHERYEELVAGYALSALEPEDEQELLRHLPTCAACERDLAVHRETLAHLAFAGDTVQPPASLWEGIRSEVLSSGAPVTFPRPAAAPDDLARARARRSSRGARAVPWIAAAAAAVLALGLAGWNVALQRDRDQLSDRYMAAVRAVESGPAQTVPLAGPDGDVAAVAVVGREQVSLVVRTLPPNDVTSNVYVLWGKWGDGPVEPLGTFDVRTPGTEVVGGLELPGPSRRAPDLMAITREPGRTAPPATQQPLLASGRAA